MPRVAGAFSLFWVRSGLRSEPETFQNLRSKTPKTPKAQKPKSPEPPEHPTQREPRGPKILQRKGGACDQEHLWPGSSGQIAAAHVLESSSAQQGVSDEFQLWTV